MLKRITFSSPEKPPAAPQGLGHPDGDDVTALQPVQPRHAVRAEEPLWLSDISQGCPRERPSEIRSGAGTHRADLVWGSTIFEKQRHDVCVSLLGRLVQGAVS